MLHRSLGNNSSDQCHFLTLHAKRVSQGYNKKYSVDFQHMGAGVNKEEYDAFSKIVTSRMKDAPFYCIKECAGEQYSAVRYRPI